MDKNVLKKFAIESRQELMEKVTNKISRYYVDEEFDVNQNGEVYVLVNDKHTLRLTKGEYENRQLLIKRIKEITLEQVIEEAAYTWFNRIIAIRYMEIHDFLPLTKENQSLGVRVLSSKDNTPDPEIMKISNLLNPELDIDFNKEIYGSIQDNNKRFEYILLLVCKKLGKVIPQVFDGITDYIDILIPDNLLNDSGYVTKLLKDVSEDNFSKVEIIGWLYQYYISEKKEIVFENLKKNIKISKNDIAPATQLFTPDWVVKYMVENSLGRYFSKSEDFDYYIKVEETDVKENNYDVEKITFLDPCCGSGHILVYALELFYNLYLINGYTSENAIKNILNKNLYGIDIDDRAAQLSILSVILKAREYDKNIFNQGIIEKINIISVQDTNNLNKEIYLYNIKNENNIQTFNYIYNKFIDAKEFGSLISCDSLDYISLLNELYEQNFIGLDLIEPIIKQAIILSNKYDIVITNPPYMGKKSINNKLSAFLNEYYPNTKSEMYSAFIERCYNFTKVKGYQAMITIHTWMFISSFQKVRELLLESGTLINMIHTGPATFPDLSSFNVLATTFCFKKERINSKTTFVRLADYYNVKEKLQNFNNKDNYYYLFAETLKEVPGYPFIYWISDSLRKAFQNNKMLGKFYPPKQGLATANNERFLRLWHEVDFDKIGFGCKNQDEACSSNKKWFPYNKGGEYRKWYGNNDWIVNWENGGFEIRNYKDENGKLRSRPQNIDCYFKKGMTWSLFGFENFGVRFKDYGFIFDVSGSSLFPDDKDLYYIIGYLCSNVAFKFLSLLAPTVNFQVGNIASLPFKKCNDEETLLEIENLVCENIELCKNNWDIFETSWDFKKNVLISNNKNLLKEQYSVFEEDYNIKRNKLRENEEKLNVIYKEIFEIKEDVEDKVKDRDLSIKIFNKEEIIKSFISYVVGCMFGRYSLDEEGLIFAGGNFDNSKYKTFNADIDNIIPITDATYLGDDIVEKFKKFISVAYGEETLYENLEFIAETLGKRNGETSEDTIRRYFINDFYNDHLKIYQKRPIYWLFDSGKKNGFKCLIYMHRYNEGLVSKIRLDYLHKIQNIYEKELKEISDKLDGNIDLTKKRELAKKQADISAKLQETKEYDEKIAHIADQRIKIDLDDGVVVNYAKFSVKNPKTGKDESILAKIK